MAAQEQRMTDETQNTQENVGGTDDAALMAEMGLTENIQENVGGTVTEEVSHGETTVADASVTPVADESAVEADAFIPPAPEVPLTAVMSEGIVYGTVFNHTEQLDAVSVEPNDRDMERMHLLAKASQDAMLIELLNKTITEAQEDTATAIEALTQVSKERDALLMRCLKLEKALAVGGGKKLAANDDALHGSIDSLGTL